MSALLLYKVQCKTFSFEISVWVVFSLIHSSIQFAREKWHSSTVSIQWHSRETRLKFGYTERNTSRIHCHTHLNILTTTVYTMWKELSFWWHWLIYWHNNFILKHELNVLGELWHLAGELWCCDKSTWSFENVKTVSRNEPNQLRKTVNQGSIPATSWLTNMQYLNVM